MKIDRMSASGLKSYKQCEKQYWYKYVSPIEPKEEPEIEHFEIGNAVHDSIENVLQKSDIDLNDPDVIQSALVSEEETLNYNYSNNDKVSNCFETASRWISSFVDDVKHVEEEWSMERNGITYEGLGDLVADIADISTDGETYENSIVDWKTGEVNDQWKERIQGGVYSEMFYDNFGEYPDSIVFVYLSEETQSFHPRVKDGEVFWNEYENKYWTEIEKYTNQILHSNNTDSWEAEPEQSKCYFCDYKLHCRDSGVGAEDVTPGQISLGR